MWIRGSSIRVPSKVVGVVPMLINPGRVGVHQPVYTRLGTAIARDSRWCKTPQIPLAHFSLAIANTHFTRPVCLVSKMALGSSLLVAILVTVANGLPHATVKRQVTHLRDSYDFVIAGGGTCGLTVADRLTEAFPNRRL